MRISKRSNRRRIDEEDDDNPMSMLTNLFDVAMVFAVALMVAIVVHFNVGEIFSSEDYTMIKNPGSAEMEIITKEGNEVKRYKPSEDSEGSGSKGKRVGTAYQLESGDIIYVPE